MRKIIQIAVSVSENDAERIALCDDGTVWEYEWSKPIWKDVPPSEGRNFSTREKIGQTEAGWKRLAPISQDGVENE